MTPKEQEIAIGELEERVDRLRNIYEQYFLGFEKLEPTVPRKDVDRRFAILRKEQIRNTAMRFRFQVVTQKYNTYAMHWVRICRQIEEGTYKRHIRKAKARFGDTAGGAADREISIDIDMDEFENTDFDSALAEANEAAQTYERDAPDTLPPPASAPYGSAGAASARQMLLTTPGTSFAVGGGSREVLDQPETQPDRNTPMPPSFRTSPDRAARGAALPAGAKPRILRKRDDTDPPPSGKTLPGAPQSSPRLPPAPESSPRIPPPSSPGFPVEPGSNPRMAQPQTSPAFHPAARGSVPRIQPARPSAPGLPTSTPSAGAQAAGRIPVAAPAPQPTLTRPGGPSAGRIPLAAPPPPPGSSPRLPVAAPAPSAGRIPGAPPLPPPAKPSAPGAKPPPPRPPMPSASDKESTPPSGEPRPSVRPRAPLPLPSQSIRPKKG